MSAKQRKLSMPHYAHIAVLSLIIVIVVIAILTLLGPSIGNVFSNTVSNMPPQGIGVSPERASSGASGSSEVSDTGWDAQRSSFAPGDQLIVKNGEITLLVEETHTAIDQVTQIALDHGGYVLTSQTWSDGDLAAAAITITVDAGEFETALRRLRDIALEVQSETTSGEDVSAEYVDLESQLRTLEATRDRLRAFLDQAETVEAALDVNQELTAIEAEIEQVKGRMAYLAGRSAQSRIIVHLSMPPLAAPTPTPAPWALGPAVESAVGVQRGLLRFLAEAVVWLGVVVGPYLLVFGVLFFGVRTWARRDGNHRTQPPTPTAPDEG